MNTAHKGTVLLQLEASAEDGVCRLSYGLRWSQAVSHWNEALNNVRATERTTADERRFYQGHGTGLRDVARTEQLRPESPPNGPRGPSQGLNHHPSHCKRLLLLRFSSGLVKQTHCIHAPVNTPPVACSRLQPASALIKDSGHSHERRRGKVNEGCVSAGDFTVFAITEVVRPRHPEPVEIF